MSFTGMTEEGAIAYKKSRAYHQPPKYYGYEGGFDKVTYCEDCSRTALYEDQSGVRPCTDCGGRIISGIVAKWVPFKGMRRWLTTEEYDLYQKRREETAKLLEVKERSAPPDIGWHGFKEKPLEKPLIRKNTVILILVVLVGWLIFR